MPNITKHIARKYITKQQQERTSKYTGHVLKIITEKTWETKEVIQTFDGQHNNIECISIRKILGRQMNKDDNLDDGIDNKLNQSKAPGGDKKHHRYK